MRHFTAEQKVLLVSTLATLVLVLAIQSSIWGPVIGRLLEFFKIRPQGPGIPIGKEWISDTARLRHTHVVGATGQGKTVLIEQLLFQDLKRGYGAVIVDPKGERSFYEKVKQYATSIGREKDLFFLSATYPEESSVWNPCSLGNPSELQTKFFNSAIYNEPHYAKACELGLLQAFAALVQDMPEGFTIQDLVQELSQYGKDDKNESLQGLYFDLNNLLLGEWGQVLACGGHAPEREISILDIIRRNQILFVDLPTEAKKVQSSRIGRLLTQEIILISGLRKIHQSLKTGQPFSVYIDEFDAFATESFATFMNKGRSSEFMIHIAHQTLSDLNRVSIDFTGQILGNCNVRFIFRQDDPDDAERWSRFLGTEFVIKKTFQTQDGVATGMSSNRQVQEFVINPNQIKTLKIGQCVYSDKTAAVTRVIRIPFKKDSAIQGIATNAGLRMKVRGLEAGQIDGPVDLPKLKQQTPETPSWGPGFK